MRSGRAPEGKGRGKQAPPAGSPKPFWQETIEAYWKTLDDNEIRRKQLIATLKSVPGRRYCFEALSALFSVPRRMNMDEATALHLLLFMGVTINPHDIDRVAAEILSVVSGS